MERKRRYHNSVLVWNHWLRTWLVFGSSRSMVKHLDSVVLDATSTCTFCRVEDPTETRNATSAG